MLSENVDLNYKITKKDIENFNQYLADYQLDILKLLQRKRRTNHLLSIEEIASNFNLHMLKNREKVIRFRNDNYTIFSKESFHYLMCVFAKNAVTWMHCREKNRKYYNKRHDLEYKTQDGTITSFELFSKFWGEEEEYSFDEDAKSKSFLKHLVEYSGWLTKAEIELVDLLMKDYSQREISVIRKCSHQAVSAAFKNLKLKIDNRIKYKPFDDDAWKNITKGNESLKNLFSYKIKS